MKRAHKEAVAAEKQAKVEFRSACKLLHQADAAAVRLDELCGELAADEGH